MALVVVFVVPVVAVVAVDFRVPMRDRLVLTERVFLAASSGLKSCGFLAGFFRGPKHTMAVKRVEDVLW